MEELPDIRRLYQKKYCDRAGFFADAEHRTARELIWDRSHHICPRADPRSSTTRRLSCIKIVKNTPEIPREDSTRKRLNQTQTKMLRREPSVGPQSHQSASFTHNKRDIMKQVLRISQQELMELQSNMGG